MSGLELLVIAVGLPAGYWLVTFLTRGGKAGSKGSQEGAGSDGGAWSAGAGSGNYDPGNRQEKGRHAGGKQQGYRDDAQQEPRTTTDAAAWHQVLGVEPYAATEDIRSAYRRQLSQYHPDKVAALGPELRELATRKSQEITAAYREAMRLKGEDE